MTYVIEVLSSTISPGFSCREHTLNTLRYAARSAQCYMYVLIQCFQLSRSTFSYLHVLHHFCKFKLYFALTLSQEQRTTLHKHRGVAPIEPIQSRHFKFLLRHHQYHKRNRYLQSDKDTGLNSVLWMYHIPIIIKLKGFFLTRKVSEVCS